MPSDALDYITVKGFKSIASIEKLKLRPINVVIGANGSGKSNFLEVFSLLHAVAEGKLGDYVTVAGGAEKVLHFGSKTTKEIEFHIPFAKGNQYELKLRPTADDGLFPAGEELVLATGDRAQPHNSLLLPARVQGREAGISDPKPLDMVARIRRQLDWRVYHLHDTSSSSPMRKTARVDDNHFLRPDGSNLAAFLYYLREKHADAYTLIQRTVQRVAPFFDDFRLAPLKLNPDDIKLEWRHRSSDQYFDASSLSDGTLRFIALATLFLQPKEDRPSVILVDEPELGLHPAAIQLLASLIRQASVDTQVIVSTQSSLLLDHFQPEDVLVASRAEGGTLLSRLDPEKLRSWLDEYSLGQLWEKNEFAGRPVRD
jgi:predicted ATPase